MVALRHLNFEIDEYRFTRGQSIFLQPSALYRVKEGIFRSCSMDRKGSCLTLGFWGVGDVIGLGWNHTYQVKAMVSGRLHRIPPDAWLMHLDGILKYTRQQEILLTMMHLKRMPERLQLVLGWLVERFGQPTAHGHLIPIVLTHQTLAETIGATRVTVTRILAHMESEGRIRRLGRRLMLL